MSPSRKKHRRVKADTLALLNSYSKSKPKPGSDGASSVISGPSTPKILASPNMPKAQIKKLQGKNDKLIKRRQRLNEALENERKLLRRDSSASSASPAWSRNLEEIQLNIEHLDMKEMTHMADLGVKLAVVTEAYRENPTSKRKKAWVAISKVHGQFRTHLGPYITDYPMPPDVKLAPGKQPVDRSKEDEESTDGHDQEVKNCEGEVASRELMTEAGLQKQVAMAVAHMNLDDHGSSNPDLDIKVGLKLKREPGAISRYSGGGTTPDFDMEDMTDPFIDAESATKQEKKEKKREKKRKRESLAAETAAKESDDEDQASERKQKKKKKHKHKASKDDGDHGERENASDDDGSSKKRKKRKSKDKKTRAEDGNAPIHDTPASVTDHANSTKSRSKRKKDKKAKKSSGQDSGDKNSSRRGVRYSTTEIPLPIIPAMATTHPPLKSTSPIPIPVPIAPNSGRRRSSSRPRIPLFSSSRSSPPPVIGSATPQPKKSWTLEGSASRAKSNPASSRVTMTIGAHPPVRPARRDDSPAEMASKHHKPGRPKGSKTESKKMAEAGEAQPISVTPIPLPPYAHWMQNEDLVRMVVPDVDGRPVFVRSPSRGSMPLEERLRRDQAMHEEERIRWFEATGLERYMGRRHYP